MAPCLLRGRLKLVGLCVGSAGAAGIDAGAGPRGGGRPIPPPGCGATRYRSSVFPSHPESPPAVPRLPPEAHPAPARGNVWQSCRRYSWRGSWLRPPWPSMPCAPTATRGSRGWLFSTLPRLCSHTRAYTTPLTSGTLGLDARGLARRSHSQGCCCCSVASQFYFHTVRTPPDTTIYTSTSTLLLATSIKKNLSIRCASG
eukprot:scaffold18078_cov112-Isochrysis_galbana.AAC.1